jgi:transglutaminase-like putative cysteine protease
MEQSTAQPSAKFDVTVRVGCSLTYQVADSAVLLLNVTPMENRNHVIRFQALALGNGLPEEKFVDSHGNEVYRLKLNAGMHSFRHDAIVAVSSQPDNHDLVDRTPHRPADLPPAVLRYTLPSRYCDSDKLIHFAWEKFGQVEHGWPRVQAISQWLHDNIEYRYGSGGADLSAWDVLQRGYGVCRDFAHLAIALNRTFNIPARYVTGHLPDIGFPDPENHMDFHAYAEVYLGGQWFTTDARFKCRVDRMRSMALSARCMARRRCRIFKCGHTKCGAARWASVTC